MDLYQEITPVKYIMKKIERKHYETPSSRIYEAVQQGVLCQSGNTEGYQDGEEYGDDDFTSN